jgi:heme/copper-type cytochrome/quinol oxidase subunit 3
VAAILSIRKSKFALLASIASGLIIMFFEFVEMLVIGSPAGPSRFMQIFFVLLGTVMIAVSLGQWFLDLVAEKS